MGVWEYGGVRVWELGVWEFGGYQIRIIVPRSRFLLAASSNRRPFSRLLHLTSFPQTGSA